ncbi:formate hydrogenlyase maturation HycH family protein [Niveibacterium umoris]|uniref:Hydrogenase-4 component J n=1 Tax=Niveibacterium umoris TaxID=1193620 RepID=A0A840BHG2_9RHOO|nr:formate hydrogenlyase maturation HycH family protein [Niveibacterium umoris]MBB4012665.1 hydrogenase-4 component J [Niveibacterium umoris]
MNGKVIFYSLGQKFLDREEDMPAEAKQVVYYSLAIGHHIGVIDCLKPILECPLAEFDQWIAKLPEGDARSKFEGIAKWGEITIDSTHTRMLAEAIDAVRPGFSPIEAGWASQLMQALRSIDAEPAIYLIAKRREAKVPA